MKTFKNMAAQGDIVLRRIEALPSNAVAEVGTRGMFVIGHSETGHNHVVMERPDVKVFHDPVDKFRRFLVVGKNSVELTHLRSFDTHEAISVQPGIYEIRKQREFDLLEYARHLVHTYRDSMD